MTPALAGSASAAANSNSGVKRSAAHERLMADGRHSHVAHFDSQLVQSATNPIRHTSVGDDQIDT